MQVGRYLIQPNVALAPMAGVTDKLFRLLCKRLGAGLAVSEMTTSDPRCWHTAKSLHRMDHVGEPDPVSVQIAGTVPAIMADATLSLHERGMSGLGAIHGQGLPCLTTRKCTLTPVLVAHVMCRATS